MTKIIDLYLDRGEKYDIEVKDIFPEHLVVIIKNRKHLIRRPSSFSEYNKAGVYTAEIRVYGLNKERIIIY